MRAPNKPVKLVARENLIALLNRMKRYYDKAAADCDALAEKMQTASDDDVGHVERELLSAFRLGSLAPKDWEAEVAKRLRKEGAATMREAKQKRHPEWPRINQVIDRELELDSKPKQIAKMLAAEGLHLEYTTLRKRIERRRKLKAR